MGAFCGFFFFFSSLLRLELRAYILSYFTNPFFVMDFFFFFFGDKVSSYLPGQASNHNPPDLFLLSSWDYRRERLAPGDYWLS
jgi:hypothetical protein